MAFVTRKAGLLVVLFLAAAPGCFKKVTVDPQTIKCSVADDCPSGYVCTAQGACCKSADDPSCGGLDAAIDAPKDGAAPLDRAGEAPAYDGNAGEARTGGAGGGGATGSGGIGGAGGSTGQGGAGGGGTGGGDDASPNDLGNDAPLGGAGGAGTGGVGSGGLSSTGGVLGTGGLAGSGGAGSGGATVGSGGRIGTGGAGSGGVTGAGGTTAACQDGETRCASNSFQTCASGNWAAPVPCGTRQTCTGPVGTATCKCNTDAVCSSVGGTCTNTTTLATCAQDEKGCFYQSTATTCTNGACSGSAGEASCCTNACTAGSKTCASPTTIQTCAVGSNGCLALGAAAPCPNGACFGAAGSAACCTNACTAGTSCPSSTTLETCTVGSNGCTVASSSSCSTGLVCERISPAECLDPNWAEWPVPNNQVEGGPNLASYTDNGDGTITDNVTKLIWQKSAPSTLYNQGDAGAYCDTLTLASRSDWRLPTVIELMTIVDLGRFGPSISPTYFPGALDGAYWTSTHYSGDASFGWAVNFYFGGPGGSYTSSTFQARCVR